MTIPSLGRYEVRSVLGRGTMGVVYRGYDPVIDRPVALKTVALPESLSEKERKTFLERFFLEAKIAGRLLHPHIVVTHDAATDERTQTPFMVMELVEGDSLATVLQARGRLPWKEAVDIALPLANALDYAHRNGVVHRDVKPANVLLAASGGPKITDFGIAKLPTSQLTRTGVVVGTPYFMSPEQLRGEPVDGRSDLFSLGALLYNLVVGRPPFEGNDLAVISHQILYKHPKPPSELRPEVPPALDGVLARALAKEATERYVSGIEFAEDLSSVEHGRLPKGGLTRGERTHISVPQTTAASQAGTLGASIPLLSSLESEGGAGRSSSRRHVLRWTALVLFGVGLLGAGPGWAVIEGWARTHAPSLAALRDRLSAEATRLGDVLEARHVDYRRRQQELAEARASLDGARDRTQRGHWAEAESSIEQALVLARRNRDGALEAAALLDQALLASARGQWSRARAGLDTAAAAFKIYDEPEERVHALLLQGHLERHLGHAEKAEGFYREALGLAETLETPEPRVEVLLAIALHDLLEHRFDGSRRSLASALASAESVRREDLAAEALIGLAVVGFCQGERLEADSWDEVRAGLRGETAIDRRASVDLLEARATWSQDRERAERRLRESERAFREREHWPGLLAALETRRELLSQGTEALAPADAEILALRKKLGIEDDEPIFSETPSREFLLQKATPPERLSFLLRPQLSGGLGCSHVLF